MLIAEPKALIGDALLQMLGALNQDTRTHLIRDGVYEIPHFGGSHFLRDYNEYPDGLLDNEGEHLSSYGVVDYPEQLFKKASVIEDSIRKFVTCFTRVTRESQSGGGWRWHKWGPYIGDKEPTCEYLMDEPDISEVFCYQIYEKKEGEK